MTNLYYLWSIFDILTTRVIFANMLKTRSQNDILMQFYADDAQFFTAFNSLRFSQKALMLK